MVYNFKIWWGRLYGQGGYSNEYGNHFWQSVDAILDDVFVTETIVWC